MLTKEILRFVDDQTFAEAEPPADRSRPLEWRRSFNTISFITDDPTIEYVYSVNEVDHFVALRREPEAAGDKQETAVVTPATKRSLRLVCQIDQEKLRDSIFCTKEKEKGAGLYELHRTKDAIQIVITDPGPTDQLGPYAAGAFAGLAFRTDFEPGENGLCIEISIPTQHLEEIAAALKTGEVSSLHIAVALQSFSYEVDDALREWYHPRDLFIHGSASPAALLSVRVARRDADGQPASRVTDDDEIVAEDQGSPVLAQPLHAPTPDYSTALMGIKAVLWVIAFILLLQLFK